ncbi:MAG: hypothetical protein OK454_05855 [Thaumarchaeota archaeon]|nr:hypothetical protein [Nitrososphaerota archaeon]
MSVGSDKGSVDRLISSKVIDEVVIPIYWKDGLVTTVRPMWLVKLPGFLKAFEQEFPDG